MAEENDNFILSSTTSTQVVNSTKDAQSTEGYICKRNFCTNIGLLQHLNTCRKKNNTFSSVNVNTDNQSAVV